MGDNGKLIDISVAITQTTADAAKLGNGWNVIIRNTSGSTVTLDPFGSQTITWSDAAAATTLSILNRDVWLLVCDGANFHAFLLESRPTVSATLITSTNSAVAIPARAYAAKIRMVNGGGSPGNNPSNGGATSIVGFTPTLTIPGEPQVLGAQAAGPLTSGISMMGLGQGTGYGSGGAAAGGGSNTGGAGGDYGEGLLNIAVGTTTLNVTIGAGGAVTSTGSPGLAGAAYIEFLIR